MVSLVNEVKEALRTLGQVMGIFQHILDNQDVLMREKEWSFSLLATINLLRGLRQNKLLMLRPFHRCF